MEYEWRKRKKFTESQEDILVFFFLNLSFTGIKFPESHTLSFRDLQGAISTVENSLTSVTGYPIIICA